MQNLSYSNGNQNHSLDNFLAATPFGQNFNQGSFWSPNVESVYKFAFLYHHMDLSFQIHNR